MIILSSGIACDWLASLDIASNVSFNESVASVRCCSNANAHTRILMRRNDIVHTIMRAYNYVTVSLIGHPYIHGIHSIVTYFGLIWLRRLYVNVIWLHTHTRTHTHIHTHKHTNTRTHACTHACTHAHTHTHTHDMQLGNELTARYGVRRYISPQFSPVRIDVYMKTGANLVSGNSFRNCVNGMTCTGKFDTVSRRPRRHSTKHS